MRALYTAATGMTAQQLKIDNIANNLANVSTTGYKKTRESFEDLIYQNIPVGAAATADKSRPAAVEIGAGARLVATTRDFRQGDLAYSGNQFDLAIGGKGFFQLQGPNGEERYSRDGRFIKNDDGELVTASGMSLQPGIRIPDEAERVEVTEDGEVLAYFVDDTEAVNVGTIQLYDFVNPSGLTARGGNIYSATPASGDPIPLDAADGFVNLQQAFLEASNVDVAEELINMVLAQRSFELNSKVIETADETMQVVNGLKR